MIIGLVRHFKVDYKSKLFLNPDGFKNSMKDYDTAPVIPNNLKLKNNDWNICYSSSLPRALTTAKTIYDGEIISTDKLIEVGMTPFTNKNILLPSFFWHIGARKHWYQNKTTQPETREETLQRANDIFDEITNCGKEKILIVSHGFFLRNFYKVLIQNGFNGKIDEAPRNGKLYTMINYKV